MRTDIDLDATAERVSALLPPGRVGVLFSGGMDSGVLLGLFARARGPEGTAALHALNTLAEGWEEEAVRRWCGRLGVELAVFDFDPLTLEEVAGNGPLRCYHCKDALCRKAGEIASSMGLAAVADGTTASDASDDRPGTAALREHGVFSPLAGAGLGRREVLELASRMGLEERPPGSCMATRVPEGVRLERGLLERLRALEAAVRAMGFPLVRARWKGDGVRLETAPPMSAAPAGLADVLAAEAKKLGLGEVEVNLRGYRGLS